MAKSERKLGDGFLGPGFGLLGIGLVLSLFVPTFLPVAMGLLGLGLLVAGYANRLDESLRSKAYARQ